MDNQQREPVADEPVADERLSLRIFLEKKEGQGEDAKPLLQNVFEEAGLLAVFDGLGGAGATKVEGNEGMRTNAYYASRIAKDVVEKNFQQQWQAGTEEEVYEKVSQLKLDLAEEMERRAERLDGGSSKLKSNLLRKLPTTMAALYFDVEGKGGEIECTTIWAGDSRCYQLRTNSGLQQLTKDDLKEEGNAFENLRMDSPMSNYINADEDFGLNVGRLEAELPTVLIVATDGCFDYMPTPMHFEHTLLSTMARSESMESWKSRLYAALEEVAGDDVSLALLAIGWREYATLKRSFQDRFEVVRDNYIEEIDSLNAEIRKARKRLEGLQQEKETQNEKLWEEYRTAYQPSEEYSETIRQV